MADRTITVILNSDMTEQKYAKLANTIWAVASSYDDFSGVQQDAKADHDFLNNWYDDKDGEARWS